MSVVLRFQAKLGKLSRSRCFLWSRKMQAAWRLRKRHTERFQSTLVNPNGAVEANSWSLVCFTNRPPLYLYWDKAGNSLTAEEYFKCLREGK